MLQSVELQSEQELPPTEDVEPLLSFEKQAKLDGTFSALPLQSGQDISSLT